MSSQRSEQGLNCPIYHFSIVCLRPTLEGNEVGQGTVVAECYKITQQPNGQSLDPAASITLITYTPKVRAWSCADLPANSQHSSTAPLVRFRLGCADLAVNSGRQAFSEDKTPRSQRFCTMPNCNDCIQDEMHMVFESEAYTHIRHDPQYRFNVGFCKVIACSNRNVQTL